MESHLKNAAAPAPSSLAGGEKYGDETAEEIVIRWASWINDVSADMEEPEWGGKTHNDVLNERDFLVRVLAALSPEAPAREVCDLEGLLTTALTDELQDGGAEVPYSIIAERVAARVADEASAPSCALTAAAEEALSFLQNAPLESGICCCGDPISGHGYGSGHSPVDDLAYHSSQVAEKLQAALTPRHEAPAEGAGEDGHTRAARQRLDLIAHGAAARTVYHPSTWSDEVAAFWADVSALRARSSAPEARSGEGQ